MCCISISFFAHTQGDSEWKIFWLSLQITFCNVDQVWAWMMKDQFEKEGEGKLYASHGLFVCSSQLVEAFEMCVPQCAYDFLFHSKNLLLAAHFKCLLDVSCVMSLFQNPFSKLKSTPSILENTSQVRLSVCLLEKRCFLQLSKVRKILLLWEMYLSVSWLRYIKREMFGPEWERPMFFLSPKHKYSSY